MASGLNPGTPPVPPPVSRRERFREQTRAEIRQAARRQMEHGGAGALSLKSLAAELGMAGPSLYRYVASRDELLTGILVEAYTELAVVLEEAAGGPDGDPATRLRGCVRAYRSWARSSPAMYELLFGTPVPGYVAPGEATGPPARRCLAALVTVVAELRGGTDRSALRARAQTVEAGDPDGAVLVVAVQIWTRVHGLVSLELHGHLDHLVGSVAELLELEIDQALGLVGS